MSELVCGMRYYGKVVDNLSRVFTAQREAMEQAARAIADAVERGGMLHTFGTGHSHMIAEEAFYRAGGLVPVSPILDAGLLFGDGAVKSTFLERVEGYAGEVLSRYQLREGDVMLVASNSGRNAVPVEMALLAKEKGLTTVAITSVSHSSSVESRHSSGKKLMELVDIVIDNGGVPGDAVVDVPGLSEAVGATSTVVGCAILNSVIVMAVEILVARGNHPPVFVSSNLDGGDAANKGWIGLYGSRIRNL